MDFTTYQKLLLETRLEDFERTFDPQDDIILLHEIEYKLSKLANSSPYSYNPRLVRNIVKRYVDIAFDIYEDISQEIEAALTKWADLHPLHDYDKFAKLIIDECEEFEFLRNGVITRGGVTKKISDITYCLSEEDVLSIVENYIGKDHLYTLFYSTQMIDRLIEDGHFPDGIDDEDEARDYYENDPDETYEEYTNNYDEIKLTKDELLTFIDENNENINWGQIPEKYLIKMIKCGFIPEYESTHFGIYDILDQIDEELERIHNGDKAMDEAAEIARTLGKEIDHADLKKIQKDIGEATSAISLGLNIFHTAGNIMNDYGGDEYEFIDQDFLDDLDSLDTSSWDEEVNQILRH